MRARQPCTSGRPPGPSPEKRTTWLVFCANGAERTRIRNCARLARLSLSAYVRQAALRGTPPPAVPVLTIRAIGQLGRLANNLNQLAKRVHQGRLDPALLPLLVDLLIEISRVRRLLAGHPPPPDKNPES